MPEPTIESAEPLLQLSVDRVVDDATTDTRIAVLSRTDVPTEHLMIWVGASEGEAIRRALDVSVTPRPMSHDLIKNFGDHLGITMTQVVLTDVKNNTYFATVYVRSNGVTRTIDARPSDAIALALRCHAPIYVTQDVWKRRGGQNLEAWLSKVESKNFGTQEV
ncbi:MAG: bifunctional nuclease family protein [Nitrospira sp.]|nr:bifunctional nuclease family protein [Nitrospira sp.]MCP9461863.1 bifunctional nuclease family protein [Nitrospira sp.]